MDFEEYVLVRRKLWNAEDKFKDLGGKVPDELMGSYIPKEEWETLNEKEQKKVIEETKVFIDRLSKLSCPSTSGYEDLIEIAKEAKKNAKNAIESDDGGSCNLDTAWVKIKGDTIAIIYAINKGGLRASPHSDKGYIRISPPDVIYQGFNRTRQVKAIADTFKNHGYSAGVSYAMD